MRRLCAILPCEPESASAAPEKTLESIGIERLLDSEDEPTGRAGIRPQIRVVRGGQRHCAGVHHSLDASQQVSERLADDDLRRTMCTSMESTSPIAVALSPKSLRQTTVTIDDAGPDSGADLHVEDRAWRR